MRHEERQRARDKRDEENKMPTPGIRVKGGDLVLLLETTSSLHREGVGPKLVHEKWTYP